MVEQKVSLFFTFGVVSHGGEYFQTSEKQDILFS